MKCNIENKVLDPLCENIFYSPPQHLVKERGVIVQKQKRSEGYIYSGSPEEIQKLLRLN